MATVPEIITSTYQGFNDRDIDAVFQVFHPQVEWPNGWEGGYLYGVEAVRDYWTRQWAAINPVVIPEAATELPDHRLDVLVKQVVKDLEGQVLIDQYVHHVYSFRDGLIFRMEIVNDIP